MGYVVCQTGHNMCDIFLERNLRIIEKPYVPRACRADRHILKSVPISQNIGLHNCVENYFEPELLFFFVPFEGTLPLAPSLCVTA